MPQIGEIKRDDEIGKGTKGKKRFIWHACEKCSKERWVALNKSLPRNQLCRTCSSIGRYLSEEIKQKLRIANLGKKASLETRLKMSESSKRGRKERILMDGYIFIYQPDHPNAGKNGYLMEHRLIMSQLLDRALDDEEVVHHINGDKTDNHPENLMLLPSAKKHLEYHKDICSKGGLSNFAKHGKDYMTEIAQKGGVQRQALAMEKKRGQALFAKYGRERFVEMGHLGGRGMSHGVKKCPK